MKSLLTRDLTRDNILDQLEQLSERIDRLERFAIMGEGLGLQAVSGHYACRVFNNANISHTSTGNWQALTFNSERIDAGEMHSTTSNTGRIVFIDSGWYLITGHLIFSNSSQTGMRGIMVRENGNNIVAVHGQDAQSVQYTWMSIATLYYFDAGEYIELLAYQSSGGNLDIVSSSSYGPEFAAVRIAA